MKLLVYSHYFAPSVGGVETIVLSLARGLCRLGSQDHRPRFELTAVTETPTHEFDDRLLPFPVVRKPSLLQLWHLIRSADVVHLAGPSLAPLVLAWLARKPVVLEHHGYQAICPNGVLVHQPDGSICPGHFQAQRYTECFRCQAAQMSWLRSFAKLLLMFPRNLLARRAALNIAISRHVQERQRLPRSSVVYYGIENTTGADGPVTAMSPDCAKLCFAFVGRLVPEKGLTVLLDAAAILLREGWEFELLLVGDGPERPYLETSIRRLGLDSVVRITGFLQGAPLAELLSTIRVVVMPSVWEETAGLAAIEQMMRGRLVIASKIGGLSEVVGDAGLLCVPGDAKDLALRMREVLQQPSKITTMGDAARNRARAVFLLDRMIDDHARIYLGLSNNL